MSNKQIKNACAIIYLNTSAQIDGFELGDTCVYAEFHPLLVSAEVILDPS